MKVSETYFQNAEYKILDVVVPLLILQNLKDPNFEWLYMCGTDAH